PVSHVTIDSTLLALTPPYPILFVFNYFSTSVFYTLSLHDALPIWPWIPYRVPAWLSRTRGRAPWSSIQVSWASSSVSTSCAVAVDRKSTRLNSSHVSISYAVFCLKKKITHESLH